LTLEFWIKIEDESWNTGDMSDKNIISLTDTDSNEAILEIKTN